MKKISLLIMHPELVVGGAEKVLLNMLDAMDRNKFQITLLLRNKAVWDSRIPPDIKVHYMFQKNPMHTGKITARMYKYMMIFFPKLLYSFLGVKGDFDIVIAYHEPMIWYLNCVKAYRITWIHTDYAALETCPEVKQLRNKKSKLANIIANRRNNMICGFDKAIFVARSAIPGYVEKTGFPRDRTEVCYNLNGEENIFALAKEPIVDTEWTQFDGIHLCAVGRIADQKAFYRLIPVMKKLKDNQIDAKLYIIGDGALRRELQKQINSNKLNEEIIIMGFRDNPYKYIRQSKLLICSSIFEAYCTVTKESIILETPFITTMCSGMKEQIGETRAGVIVENSDSALPNAVLNVLKDEFFYNSMKHDIHRRHMELSDEKIMSRIEDVLCKCVTEKGET